MSRTLFFSLIALLSCKIIIAENHRHEKKDTVVIVENQKDHRNHHCEEKRSLKALCCQFTRNYIREGLTVIALGGTYYISQDRSDCLPNTLVACCI